MILYCVLAVAGLVLGGAVGWFAGRNKLQAMLAASEAARRSESEAAAKQQEMLVQQIGEQKKLLSTQMFEQERLQREASQKQFENLEGFEGITKYSIKLLPLGGSCMMVGEDEVSDADDAFGKKGVWARFSVIFARVEYSISRS